MSDRIINDPPGPWSGGATGRKMAPNGWDVTFYVGDDEPFVFDLVGWEFDMENEGHPVVEDPRAPGSVIQVSRLADELGWPAYEAGLPVRRTIAGEIYVARRDDARAEEPRALIADAWDGLMAQFVALTSASKRQLDEQPDLARAYEALQSALTQVRRALSTSTA